MRLPFIPPLVSIKFIQTYPFRFIFSFLLFLFICSTNNFSQSLTAEQIYKKVSDAVVVIYAYDYNDQLAAQGSPAAAKLAKSQPIEKIVLDRVIENRSEVQSLLKQPKRWVTDRFSFRAFLTILLGPLLLKTRIR